MWNDVDIHKVFLVNCPLKAQFRYSECSLRTDSRILLVSEKNELELDDINVVQFLRQIYCEVTMKF